MYKAQELDHFIKLAKLAGWRCKNTSHMLGVYIAKTGYPYSYHGLRMEDSGEWVCSCVKDMKLVSRVVTFEEGMEFLTKAIKNDD